MGGKQEVGNPVSFLFIVGIYLGRGKLVKIYIPQGQNREEGQYLRWWLAIARFIVRGVEVTI